MARRMTPNQKAWQREMLRIEEMARSIGIEDVASIKPNTPDKITKKHIAQAEAITMDYVREKAQLESAGIKQPKRAKPKGGKAVGGTKKPDYVHKPRRPLTEAEKQQRAENLRRGRQSLTHEQLSESAKKGAGKRSGAAEKAAKTRHAKLEEIKNLPKVSDVAVNNFFSMIKERLDNPRARDNFDALMYFYEGMMDIRANIGNNRFASLLMLADQEGADIYLTLPPSEVNQEWVMGAITAFNRIIKKYNLEYGRKAEKIWEEMAEQGELDGYEES